MNSGSREGKSFPYDMISLNSITGSPSARGRLNAWLNPKDGAARLVIFDTANSVFILFYFILFSAARILGALGPVAAGLNIAGTGNETKNRI